MDRYWPALGGKTPTTIPGKLSAGATAVLVADPAAFGAPLFAAAIWVYPTDAAFDPDLEVVTVSAVAGNVLYVARGTEGTAAAEHAAGAYIMQVPTPVDLEEIQAAIAAPGLPPGGTVGQVLAKVAAADGLAGWHTLTAGDVSAAPSASGVTNGDSHDHAGGDGAAIPLAGMANMATASLLGRTTALAGAPEVVSAAAARTLLNVADGANAYVHPNHSGDVTSVADGAQTIAAGAVTLAKQANLAANSVQGNNTGSAAVPKALTVPEARALLTVNNVANVAQVAQTAGSAEAWARLQGAFLRVHADPTKIVTAVCGNALTGTTLVDAPHVTLAAANGTHPATLVADASTLSPGHSGMARSLTLPGAAGGDLSWGDHADFTMATGFTLIFVGTPSSVANKTLLAKASVKTGANQAEWIWWFGGGKLELRLYSLTVSTTFIRGYYDTAFSAATEPHVYGVVWNGGTNPASAIALYRDCVPLTLSTSTSGTFTGIGNGTAPLALHYLGADEAPGLMYQGGFNGAFVSTEQFTAAQMRLCMMEMLGAVGRQL